VGAAVFCSNIERRAAAGLLHGVEIDEKRMGAAKTMLLAALLERVSVFNSHYLAAIVPPL
jgi:hypothetical protein